MKSNWTPRWLERIRATLVWRRFRERALLRARHRSQRDRTRRSGLARLDGLARLEPRTLLAADIATDRFDYAPGSTALITTFSDGGPDRNFLVGETIQFQVVRTDGIADNAPGNLPWRVTDGVGGFEAYVDEIGIRIAPDRDGIADGRIETDWFVGSEYANASLEVRAFGLTSGETATEAFHDSAIVITANTAWSQITTGSGANGAPTANDSIVVNQGVTLTIDVNGAVAGGVTLGNGAAGTATLAFSTGTIGATFGSLASNGTARVTFNNANSTLTVGTANTSTTFTGTISGAGSLTKVGTGSLTLSGTNTYTGGTNIIAGVLSYGADNVLPDTGSVTVNGGTLALGGHADTVGVVSLQGGGSITGRGAITGGGVANPDFEAVTVTGFAKPSGASWTFTNNAYISRNGSAFGFTHTPSGTQFGILQSYSGNGSSLSQSISVTTAGYASFAFRGQGRPGYGSAAVELVIDGTVQSSWSAAAFTLGAWGDYISQPVYLTAGSHTLQFRSVAVAGDRATAIDAIKVSLPGLNGSSYDLQNGSVSANLTGSGALTKSGSGTVTLSGGNTYSGGTAINDGVLVLGSTGALGTASTISFGGGTLQYSASNTIDYSSRFSTAPQQVYRVDTNGQNVTYAGALASVGGSLRKSGAGTLTLTGNVTYAGGTIVSGGTLKLGASNILADSGAVILSGGTLDLGASSDTIGSLTGPGTVTTTTGVLTVTGRLAGGLATGNIGLTTQATFSPSVGLQSGGASTVAGLTVAGTVDLGGSGLELTIDGRADVGQAVTIIDNDGSDPIIGGFAGISDGTVFLAGNGQTFRIDYAGGDGNDVVITRVLVPLEVSGITAHPRPFDGTTNAVLEVGQAYLVGLLPADASTILVTQGATGVYADPNAGANKPVIVSGLALQGPLADNYELFIQGVEGTIDRAQAWTQGPDSVVFNGSWQQGVVYGYGINGEFLGSTVTNEIHRDAGVHPVTWQFVSPDQNYEAFGSGTFTVHQAHPSIHVTPYVVVENGQEHMATGTATGVNGEDLSAGLHFRGTVHTAPGTYSDRWYFISPNPNYADVDPGTWFDDDFPAGANLQSDPSGGASWFTSDVPGEVYSGRRSLERTANGLGQDFYSTGAAPIPIPADGVIILHVWLDPLLMPSAIMLQLNTNQRGWDSRAVWGDIDALGWGEPGTASRFGMGPLPKAGVWAELKVQASDLGLLPGQLVNGFALTQHGGHVRWDRITTNEAGVAITNTILPAAIDAPIVSLKNDTGAIATDGITSIGTLAVTGVASGNRIEYSIDAGATWSGDFTAVEGGNVVLVRQVEFKGASSEATKFEFTLDTLAPASPGLSLTNDTGSSGSDRITSDGSLSLSGVEAGTQIEYSTDGGQTWNDSFTTVEGSNQVFVRQVDLAGNVSFTGPKLLALYRFDDPANAGLDSSGRGATAENFGAIFGRVGYQDGAALFDGTGYLRSPVDVSVGALPRLTWGAWVKPSNTNPIRAVLSADDGGYDRDIDIDYRGNGVPEWSAFTGNGVVGSGVAPSPTDWVFVAAVYDQTQAVMTLYVGDTAVTATTGFGPSFNFFDIGHNPGSGEFFEGAIDNVFVYGDALTASQIADIRTGGFSGTGPGTLSFEFTLDTQAAAAPTVSLTRDTGTNLTDRITSVADLTIGNVEPGATVEYSMDGGRSWSPSFSAVEGTNLLGVRQVDVAGNVSPGTPFEFTLDTQAAAAPTVSLARDTGTNLTDRITSVADLTIGNVETGATVEYSVDGGRSWSPSFVAVEGTNVLEVRQFDVAGNRSPGTQFAFTLDTRILPLVPFHNGFGTLLPDGIAATTTLDFSACTVPLTFTLHPNGSLTVEDTRNPFANGLTFKIFGDIVGGQASNRFVFVGSATMKGSVIGNATATNTLDYSESSLTISVDLGTGLATGTGGFRGINVVIGSTAIGDAGGNTLIGSKGGSVWAIESPGRGSVGGLLFSGINDIVAVAANDTLDYSLAASGVTVNLALGAATGFRQISGFRSVIGSPFDDSLVGDGHDNTFSGLSGNDSFDGGDGTDTVGESANVDFTLTSATLTGLGTDTLAGIEGVSLTGGAGANAFTLQGWTGNSILAGGVGSDRYVFTGTGSASVTIVESGDADTDTLDFTGLLNGGVTMDLAATTVQTVVAGLTLTLSTVSGIENVTGTAFADTLAGNARDNVLSGLAGDDSLSGLSGSDTFVGGAGADTVIEAGDVDFRLTATGLVGRGTDSLAGIEGVSLTAGAGANTFTVQGWTGNSILVGGTGNDSYVFAGTGSGSVTIVESADADADALDFTALLNGGVTIDLAVTTAQSLASGLTLTLSSATGLENVIGTAFADTLVGNARDNRVAGLAGDDTLSGRAGTDSLDGGAGVDAVVESGNIDFTLAAALLTGLGTEALVGVESIRLTGGEGANTFTLAGWTGRTVIDGGAGSDRYVFRGTAAANVTLVEAADTDSDTIDFSDLANAAVNVDLASTAAQAVAAGLTLTLSSLTGIENVVGTALADTLLGNTRDNSLSGLAGNDTFTGLSGNDTFIGGAGIDTVVESADVDFTLTAAGLTGIGSDALDGIETVNVSAGASANRFTIDSWAGAATLTGAAGNDSYLFLGTLAATVTINEAANTDTDTLDFTSLANGAVNLDLAVTGSQTVVPGLTLRLSSVTGIEDVTGTAFADTVRGNTRDNRLSGLAGTDTLVGRTGDDTFIGSAGDDSFDGGIGTDTVIESADIDFTLAPTTLIGLGTDTLASIERANLTTGASANTFTVQGWTGVATLTGLAGSDRYVFSGTESASVTIVEGADADTDTLDFTDLANGGVSLDLAATTAQTLVAGLTLTLSTATGIEDVTGTAFADTVRGNARDNTLAGLAGDDTLSGHLGNDSFDGGAGTDTTAESADVDFTLAAATLTGVGSDTLAGIETVNLVAGAGHNTFTVDGWTGNASLTGGAGNDFYVFTWTASANVAIVESADIDTDLLDFTTLANGGVSLDLAVTTAQTVSAGLTLTLSSATGLENVTGTAFADTLLGNARANVLTGLAGDDTLSGRDGNDAFDGGTDSDAVMESADVDFTLAAATLTGVGSDSLASVETVNLTAGIGANTFTVDGWTGNATLTGAAGNDRYMLSGIESASVTIVEAANTDSDTLDFSNLLSGGVSIDLAVTAAQTVVSGLTLTLSSTTGIENVTGTALADTLQGNARGNLLAGLAGDDTLTGRGGNDSLDGGSGSDTVTESGNVDFTLTAAGLVGRGTDLLAGIESVNLTGNAGANTITVDGWTGIAVLSGGAGDDTYVFAGTESASVTIIEAADADTDTLDFTGLLNGGVSLDLAVLTAQTAVAGLTLTLSTETGLENVTGTAFADSLVGNARANTLVGLSGDDVLTGRVGDDTLDGGAGIDTVVESADVDFALASSVLTGLGSDTLADIEGAILTGGAGANSFTVNGWTGSALLSGAAGGDVYAFAGTLSATVTILETVEADADTLDFTSFANGGVTVDLAVTATQTAASGLTVTLSSDQAIENVIGSAFADVLFGNTRANTLSGLGGDDTLTGRAGDDTFTGGDGTDTVTEAADIDFTLAAASLVGLGTDSLASVETASLTAGGGANTLTLTGWAGAAILTGGAGNDSYVFSGTASASVTIVEVADTDTDTLDFTALAGGGVSLDLALTTAQTIVSQATLTTAQTIVSGVTLTLTLSSDTSIENVIGTALTDTILGNGRNNTLLGFAGDDALAGRSGDDTLVGGVGNDNLDGGDGTDTVVASADVDFTLTLTALTGLGTDTLAGIEGANLTAGSGANTFTVGDWTGSAALDGGTGNDTYVFTGTESASVTIVEAGNADADTLDFSGLSNGGVNLDLAATTAQALVAGLTATLSSATGIEHVVGTAFADTILGNARDNTLLGIAGDDELAGRAGDDTFAGGAGDDRFDGGAGTDTVVESADVDFTLTAAGLVGRGTDSLAGIETVSLTAGGEANTFTVAGWTGNAFLSGAAGDDRYVFSGTESASVSIIEGADTDADTLDFTGLLSGGVTIDLAVTTAQTLVAGLTLTLSSARGIENVTGTAFADTLAGNSRDNSLSGLAGDDTFSGLAGNDTFVGGDGTDTVVASADVDFTLSPTTLAGLGSDTLAGIEGARLTAGSGANTFTVQSWTGSAILSGGAGNDSYVFSGTASASVTIIEADDADTDALDLSSFLNGGVNLDLAVTTAQTLVAGLTVALSSPTGIENVVGTAFADTVVGNARDNILAGLAGDDTLAGRGGDDTFTGGAGNDAFAGGDGIDTVVESADVDFTLTPTTLTGVGSDTLAGIEGANLTAGSGVNTFTVDAWTGSAILSGAAGNDAYVFTGSESASVTIFEAADADTDSIDFTNLANGGVNLDLAATTPQTLVAGLTLTLSNATGLENVIGTALADTIFGNARANTLSGLAGDDTLAGRDGDDRYVFAGALLTSVTVVESADADSDTLDFSGISNGGLTLDLGVTTPQSIATGLTVTLSTATGLENAIGTTFADTLVGNTRDNTFSGLAGDDRLDGGAGTDTVVESGDVDFTLTPTTLSGVGSDTLAGIEAARLMAGAGANTFTVNAWAGTATLTGDAGSDRYVFVGAVSASIAIVEEFGANTDTLDFSALSLGDDTGVSVDLALTASQSVTATLTLTLSDATGIENVTGTAAADTMLGNARDNAITALGGDDTLAGRAGSNMLDGGAGTDTAIETGNVDATVTAATITGVGSDVLVSIEVVDLVGGDGANTFTVNGWGGSLILAGGLGNDSYVFVGGTSTTVRIVEVANADADTLDFSAVTLTGGAGLTVDLADTTRQEVTDGLFVTLFSGEGIENVVGSNAADTMSGNGRNNVFRGLGGHDVIDGRDGSDTFVKAFSLVDVIVSNSSLIGSGTDSFSNIEVLNVTLVTDPSDPDQVGLDGRILDASKFSGTLIANFGTDSLEITRSTTPSGLATSTLILPALLESLSVVSGTIYLGAEIVTGPGGFVSLDSSGAIIDDNDPEATGTEPEVPSPINNVIASRLVLRSVGGIVGGIGMDDILDTQVSFLTLTNSGSGDVSVLNQKNVPGAVEIVEAVNSAGNVAVENYGDDTRGITVSGAVRSKGIVSLISHSPLTIDGSIQSTSGSEITLEADTLTMTKTSKIVTTGDVAMNSRVVSLTDADMADAKIKNSRSDAQIDVSGGSFNTLTSTGKGSQIDVRGGAFKTLTATGKGSQIDVRGGSFDALNTSDVGKIDVSGGIFKTLSASGAGKIDVAGGSFEELITSGSGALGISDGSFKMVKTSGSGGIDVRGGNFEFLSSSGEGAIDVSGGKFSVGLGSSGAGKISVKGGDFDQLFASGTGDLGITDGSFKTVTVVGSGAIDVRGGKFTVGLGSSGAAKINVSGGDFDQLVASGTGDLGISDGSFKTVTVTGSGAIDVRGGKFSVLSSSGAGKIAVNGGSFTTLNASGSGEIAVTGGKFNTLNASGSGGIDIRGGAFKVGVNSTGSGNKISVAGADMVSLRNSGAGSTITVGSTRFESITNDADNVSLAVVGDSGSNALINSGNDVTISFAAGAGDDVFVNDGRGDDDHGARVALTIDLGDGRDRAVLGGTALAGSIAGGSGDDTVLFVDGVTGTLALDEVADLDTDALDFSSLSVVGGVGVAVDLALTTTQVVKSGLSLTLTSGSGFEDAVGSSGADTLRGNSRDNALFGSDLPDDRLGTPATSNGRVQVAYLEFDSETDASVGDHVYTSDERAAIATRLASIYSAFSVQFVLDVPALGEYVTIKFNKPRPGSEDSGGWASEVDFGNRSYSGIATVDVNGLLGVPGGPVATSEHFVASSSWLAAHELSHLLGLRHADSFGPPGFGIAAPPGRSGYYNNPEYVGPSAAWETDRHIIETPALTGFTLWDLVAVQFFGEREAIKLVYNDMAPMTPDGSLLVAEQATPHDTRSLSGAQELLPVPLSLPNTLNHGLNAAKDLMAGAVAVLGELTATGELDLYRIAGRRGDLLNIQVMSSALDRYKQSSSSLDLDAVLTVYDAAGIVVSLSDDEFETRDPSIIDLVLPADGIYYIEVKGFYHDDGQAADTGSYELFLSRFEAASVNDAGDILEGRGGNDTLAGGRGDDTYVFQGTALGTDAILEDVRLEKSGLGATGSVDGRDSGDTLDFTNFASAVSIDLASTAVQVVAAGDLSLRLSSAVESADEPSASRGLERVLGSALGNTVAGNARANTFDGGGSVNAFQGADAADTFQLGGGSNTVDAGAGADAVTLPGRKADYTIAISGSTVTVSSLPGVVPVSESILTSVEVVRFRGDGTATLLVGVGDGFASVQAAVDAAAAGDTILVAPGSYSGAIDLDKDDLTLVSSAGNEATTLLGAGATATVTVSATGVIVRGFGIDNAGVAGGSAILIRSSADVTVDGNVIRNAVSGVSHVDDGGSAGAVITGNTFASTVQSGITGTVNLAIAGLSGNTFRTSVAAINLGSGVSLAGNALDRAGIFALIDAQSIDLSGGAAVVDSRSSTTYAVVAPSVEEYQQTVAMAPSTGIAGAATFAVVAGADAGLFQIDGATGLLRFANRPRYTAPADVGADNVAEVIVRATDGTHNVVTRYTMSVVDVNVAPEFAAATRVVSLAENIAVAGVAAATDWDLDTLGYSIAVDATDNADGALFTLHPVTGVLTFQVAPDFENPTDADRDGIYQVRVAATDPGGLVSHQVVTVVVSDTNDNAPVFTSAATATVAENTAVSAVVYTATRTDADATAAYRNVSYSIKAGAGDGVRVAVNAATGAVTLLTPADYETKTSYLFVVVADDGVNRSERIVTLNVIDANDSAPVITSAATGSVVENAATTAVIYTATRTDADVTAAFRQVSWSVKPAVGDAAMVAIQSTTGVVTLRAPADFETKTSYVFTIVASDGLNTTENSVTVNVVDANDSAPVITSGATGSVTENAATTTVIYTATRTDADVTAAFRQVTYSVKSAVGDAARVAINATTGAVTLLAAADYEAKTSYQFTIIASDGLNAAEQAVTVTVIDTNDSVPVITSATTGTVAENAATSTVIYTATRTDADVTAAFRDVSYSIKPLVGDAARVTIHPATGAVTLLASADFEAKKSYLFTVVASDGINRAEKAVTVSVTDLNDNAPVITSAAVGTVAENAATSTVIYTATRTDADVTAAFRLVTYSIKPAVGDAASVAIHPSTGAVTLLASADFEAKTSYLFTVVASDGVNRAEKVVTVAVVNVDDTAATFTSGRVASVVASATLNPVIYTATVNDSTDVSQGVAFSLAAADATLFAIDATTGVVTVKGSTLAMKGKIYTFTVTATDKGGAKKAASQSITLTVT